MIRKRAAACSGLPVKRGSQAREIAWEILQRAIIVGVLLLLATAVAHLKLLALLNDTWGDYAWGVSHSLTAIALAVCVESISVIKLVRARRMVGYLRQTIEEVIACDLATLNQQAFLAAKLDRRQLEELVTKMLADAAHARSRLERAVGRAGGAVPETDEPIDVRSRGLR